MLDCIKIIAIRCRRVKSQIIVIKYYGLKPQIIVIKCCELKSPSLLVSTISEMTIERLKFSSFRCFVDRAVH